MPGVPPVSLSPMLRSCSKGWRSTHFCDQCWSTLTCNPRALTFTHTYTGVRLLVHEYTHTKIFTHPHTHTHTTCALACQSTRCPGLMGTVTNLNKRPSQFPSTQCTHQYMLLHVILPNYLQHTTVHIHLYHNHTTTTPSGRQTHN